MSREEAAANAISESSGMRFDGFWSRVEDLEPEDREHALQEATNALAAADAHDAAHGIHRVSLDDKTVERAAKALCEYDIPGCWPCADCEDTARAVLAAAVEADQ